MNFYSAKRLFAALQVSLKHHEATFGVLETDIMRRNAPGAVQCDFRATASNATAGPIDARCRVSGLHRAGCASSKRV